MSIGILASISSGIVYAFYNIIAQKCLEKCHPVPFTWISFAITLIISGACLPFSLSPTTQIDWTPIWIGSILSGIFSFAGHSLNNLGIRMINATTTSIIGSISPALTALIAGLALSETLSTIQMVGIGIVTLGIGLLSAEKVIC